MKRVIVKPSSILGADFYAVLDGKTIGIIKLQDNYYLAQNLLTNQTLTFESTIDAVNWLANERI